MAVFNYICLISAQKMIFVIFLLEINCVFLPQILKINEYYRVKLLGKLCVFQFENKDIINW